ncbi:MAG TPA: sortase [Anaerolineales bacterium]|nr:sortase [Anaerolineales bacterium]
MKQFTQNSYFIFAAKVLLAIAVVVQPQFFLQVAPVHAANPAPIQTFYLSMPEDQVFASFKKISSSAPVAPMHSVTGISVTTTNTQIYYDHWENGFEADLANPVNVWSAGNTGGTQIWGNGLAADGCPPNVDGKTALVCSDTNDVLTLGNVIVLENDVPLPRTSAIFYDGRDKLGGTTVLAVTRSLWAKTPGTVLGDAVEVYDSTRWGTSYEMPVGEDTTNNPQNSSLNPMFNYSSLMIVAAENGTTVTIDKDGPGAVAPISVSLNQGDAYQVDGGMKMGGTVTSNKPVQANLLTGKLASTYASRWYSLPPQSYWTDSLWTSVGTTVANYPSTVFIYNPSNSAAMAVNYETKLGTGNFNVPANGTYRFEMPLLSGAHFYTSGIPFMAVGGMDASLSGANQTYDWGYTLVPDTWLTTGFVAGWAPGTATYAGNGSPVWVTATKPTTIYVDYGAPSPVGSNLDPKGRPYDISYALGQYESKQIYGVSNTQTGMKVWTADGTSITGAWGEDPKTAGAGTPYLDVGYTIPPLPEVIISKQADLAIDLNSNGQADPGDTLQYTLTVRNNGAVTAFNIAITDSIPLHTTYVAGSTRMNGSPVADNPSFPLLGTGVLVPSINIGGSVEVTYKMKTDTTPPVYSEIVNTANANINGDLLTITLHTPVNSSATTCTAAFMNSGYSGSVTIYEQNGTAYIQVTDLDKNVNASLVETISAQVVNASTADRQLIALTETGVATGIFRVSLPTSSTAGQLPDDGTLYALTGNSIQVTYADPLYGDSCNASATMTAPAQTKQLYLSGNLELDRVDPVTTGDLTTAESAALFTGGSGTITAAATTGASSTGAVTSLTFSHTPGNGSNRLLLVSVATGSPDNSASAGTVSTVTFNGTLMSLVGSVISPVIGTNTNSYIYMLKDANITTTGAANVVVTNTNSTVVASATTFTNVDQTTPLGTYRSNANSSNSANLSLATPYVSAAGEVVFSLGSVEQGTTNRTIATSAGQTQLWNVSNHAYVNGATSTIPGAASVNPTYTASAARIWTIGVVSIKPSGAAGNPSATFTLAPALAGQLKLPASATVTAPLYLNVTGGTVPASPSITGILKYGTSYGSSTAFASLNTASYSGGLLSLSGTLGASETTIPAGSYIYLDVTTAQSGATFTIRYDSSAYPSRIDLPTTTVIKVDSVDFYDAPSPDGTVVASPSSGQTVYIRTSVSDPFGFADINSASLEITDPASGVTTQSLDAYMVSSASAVKIYEIPWLIPVTTGTYTIKVTAKEGYENSITDARSTQVTIAFQDTGTPSTVEFTSGSNGAAATSYDPVASPTNQICLRVTDFDQNQNPAVAETLTVTLASSKGDTQTVILTETGVNTGIFVNCLTRETISGAGGIEPDGQIYALAGDLLTVNYTDPTDPGDISTTNAVMTSGTSVLTLSKQVMEPVNAVALIGETIRFDVVIANPNANALTTVYLEDLYPSSCLTFDSASIAPDNAAANPLVWTNIGPIASHGSQMISLYFIASAVCDSTAGTNRVDSYAIDSLSNRIPVSGTVNATASVTTTSPGLTVTKSLKAGSPDHAQLNQDVTFTIDVNNTGSTQITNLPLIDNYSAYCMEFKSATNGGTGSGGTVAWDNLGPLNAGSSIQVEATFTVQGSCAVAQNLAVVDSAYDVNGDSVPTAQSVVTIETQVQAPTVTKTFSPPALMLNEVSILTFDLANPNAYGALTSVSFTDTYPSGLVNDNPLVTTNTCTGGALTATAGGGSISYSGGTLPATGSCSISVKVKAVGYGALNNNVTVAALNSISEGTDTDTLTSVEINAVDDNGTIIDGTIGGQLVANVLTNDVLNGASPVLLTDVDLTLVSVLDSSNNPTSAVTLDLLDGSVDIAALTAPDTYTLSYQICDKLHPAFCDTAVVTIEVGTIDAVNDTGTSINGAAGGQAVANVLANDYLNAVTPVLLADVNLTQEATTNVGVTLNTADGSVNVAAGTSAGTYTVTYKICDKANPTLCNTATVSVQVVTIDAVNDSGAVVNGTTGGQSFVNVLTNDYLNGTSPVLWANVNLTQEATTNAGMTLNTADGSINVAAGVPSGSYTVTYKICDKLNPAICDTATVTVPVVTVNAVNDSGSVVDGTVGGQALANVLANDSLNGTTPVLLANVNLTQESTTNAGVTLDLATGAVNVAAGTAAGTYTVTYKICDKLNPTACDTATVSVPVVTINAVDDSGSAVNGTLGGQALANVLANDYLNGTTPVPLVNVNLTQEASTHAGVTLNAATGAVNVAAGTPSGSYTVTYKICDKANATICDTATVSVQIVTINAVDDAGTAVDGIAGGQAVADVLVNDSLNGTTPVLLANVNLTQESTTNAGVTLNVADGSVNVAAGTLAGSYTVVYKICDKTNSTICDTASVTADVIAIDAFDDNGSTVNGTAGGESLANVLANDYLNGASPVLLANVNLTQESTTNSSITLNVANGTVNVAAGTASGNYTVTYKICSKVNTSVCDTASVTVPVVTVDAVNDIGLDVDGSVGGQSLADVLANDSLNSISPVVLSDVILTQESTTNTGVTLDVTDGSVNVAAATPAGTVTVTYKICDAANMTVCDTATVSVTVIFIDAVNDTGAAVDGTMGGQSLSNVLANDYLNGATPVSIADVTLTQESVVDSGSNPASGVTLNLLNGSVSVAPGTASDTYILTYKICEKDHPVLCDTATVSVRVTQEAADLSVHKVVDVPSPKVGDTVSFTITLTNHSLTTAATNVVVLDALPAGLSLTSVLASNGTYDDTTGEWTITSLPANTDAVLRIDAVVNQPGSMVNTAEVIASDQVDPNSIPNNHDPLEDDQSSVSLGSLFDPPSGVKTLNDAGLPEIEYRMVWINSGNAAAIDVQVVDSIPVGTTYVTGSIACNPQGSSSNAASATAPLNTTLTNSYCAFDAAGGRIQWQGSIGADNGHMTEATAQNEVVITFRVAVDASVNQVNNFATSRTDTDDDGDFTAENVLGTSLVLSNQAVWNRSTSGAPSDSDEEEDVDLPNVLPSTGFAPNTVTTLPEQPVEKMYAGTGIWLEIPALKIQTSVVGVPLTSSGWDISWLSHQTGWLEGTAYPGSSGNSTLTGHVTLSNGESGTFAALSKLSWGDRVIIHANGLQYIYEVRENRTVRPENTSILGHEDKAWLTLLTCKSYDPEKNEYSNRTVVKAVLVTVREDQQADQIEKRR